MNNMFKKSKEGEFLRAPEYAHVASFRVITMVIIGTFILSFGAIVYFSYQLVFTTIGRIEYVNELKTNLYFESIDFNRLDKVRKYWAEKQSMSTISNLNDPFSGSNTSTILVPNNYNLTSPSL